MDHLAALSYIRQHESRLSISHIHGVLKCGFRTWVFMERARGDALQSKWGCLSDEQKSSVRDQLDSLISVLRCISPPSSEESNAVYVCGRPRRCVDNKLGWCMTEVLIGNEDEFNEFLISNTSRAGTPYMDMVESVLETSWSKSSPPSECAANASMKDDKSNKKKDLSDSQIKITVILDWDMWLVPGILEVCEGHCRRRGLSGLMPLVTKVHWGMKLRICFG